MTGPEHYTHAEDLIKEASKDGKSQAGVTVLLARAQVHATLALAAAQGLALAGEMPEDDYQDWLAATAAQMAELRGEGAS